MVYFSGSLKHQQANYINFHQVLRKSSHWKRIWTHINWTYPVLLTWFENRPHATASWKTSFSIKSRFDTGSSKTLAYCASSAKVRAIRKENRQAIPYTLIFIFAQFDVSKMSELLRVDGWFARENLMTFNLRCRCFAQLELISSKLFWPPWNRARSRCEEKHSTKDIVYIYRNYSSKRRGVN